MRILVVTPTLGISPWLAATVESVATWAGACEHLLVAPREAVAALQARFPRTGVVADPGGGMYAAINAGLAAGRDWEAFTYLNDDDLLLADFAAVGRAIAAGGRPRLAIAYGVVRLVDAQGGRLGAIPVSPDPRLNRALYAQRIEPVYQHGTIATRAVVDRIGGFDASLRLCGDSEFLARACVEGVPFVRATGREVAAFRLRPGQLTKNRAAMNAERLRVDEKLKLPAPRLTLPLRWARWRFRLANLGRYAERIRRYGFVSFDELLARQG
jgi:hypothetical protein